LRRGNAQLHGGVGRLYLQKREFADAERELKIAIHLDKGNVVYWKDLTATFYQGGNYAAALAGYDVVEKDGKARRWRVVYSRALLR